MQTYNVKLQSEISNSYRCKRAADSLDIDVNKKSVHELQITADLTTNFNVGLIVGSSGSGKTTLCKKIFGDDCFFVNIDKDKPIIDQFPDSLSYDQCAELLTGIGLTSVPCWIRPVKTLSNGQLHRAMAALALTSNSSISVLDEWTSVVDRTVAKVMSHCIQKFFRKNNKKIILCSCHYDVIEWLNPDWIIDCNKQQFEDRRLLQPEERQRKDKLRFDIKEIDRSSWKYFSKYHYLSDKIPGGKTLFFGLFHNNEQIGFQCFANYVPKRKNKRMILHSNRTVIHPDFAGLGLGIKLINESSKLTKQKGFDVMAKFSSTPIFKAMIKNPQWKLNNISTPIGRVNVGGSIDRQDGYRTNLKIYSFKFIG